ncbi:MAG: polysaccharide deacetylase family protein, partial [Acidobacteriota bacterium]
MRNLAFKLLRWSLLPTFFNFWQRRAVTVVAFHDPSPEKAGQYFRALTKRYSPVSLDHLLRFQKSPGQYPLPPRPLLLTLDDGHRGNYRLLPLFRQFGIRPAIFLCSEICGTRRHYWFLEYRGDLETLKKLDDQQRLETLRQNGFEERSEDGQRQALSWEEIEEMKAHVDFQAHTATHPILTRCSDRKCRREILQPKRDLEERLGVAVTALAYPNGDCSRREVEMARQAGYRCAFTVEPGVNSESSDPFRLKRIALLDDSGVD